MSEDYSRDPRKSTTPTATPAIPHGPLGAAVALILSEVERRSNQARIDRLRADLRDAQAITRICDTCPEADARLELLQERITSANARGAWAREAQLYQLLRLLEAEFEGLAPVGVAEVPAPDVPRCKLEAFVDDWEPFAERTPRDFDPYREGVEDVLNGLRALLGRASQ